MQRTARGLATAAVMALAAFLAAPADAQQIKAPSRAEGATVARVVVPSFARTKLPAPRRGRRVSTQTSWTGQAHSLLVLDSARHGGRQWVKLLLAVRPNGTSGWVPRDHVVLSRTPYWVDIRIGPRLVTVYRKGNRVRRFRAVVGKPSTPTPLGLSAIYEVNRQPNPGGFLGPWVLPLTSLSNVLKNFGGGPGRTAIHGRGGASFSDPLGSARSHGCIRVDNPHISWMAARVPVGTPVLVKH
jgi:lipoprotein-anchoring transpeptidase ErfK/SrfK